MGWVLKLIGYVAAAAVAVLGLTKPEVLPLVGAVAAGLCGVVAAMKPLATAFRLCAKAVGTDKDFGDKAAETFEKVVYWVADILVAIAQPLGKAKPR